MEAKEMTRIDRFLGRLNKYVDRQDRGALADLRRGFSEATEHRAWPYISPWCDLTNKRERMIWTTIAAGFATLGGTSKSGNMGATLRAIALGGGGKKPDEALASFDGRFRRLLTCQTAEELCNHLPGVIRTAKQKGVPVDFHQLYWDLVFWTSDKRDVPVAWAAAYWGTQHEEGGDTE